MSRRAYPLKYLEGYKPIRNTEYLTNMRICIFWRAEYIPFKQEKNIGEYTRDCAVLMQIDSD